MKKEPPLRLGTLTIAIATLMVTCVPRAPGSARDAAASGPQRERSTSPHPIGGSPGDTTAVLVELESACSPPRSAEPRDHVIRLSERSCSDSVRARVTIAVGGGRKSIPVRITVLLGFRFEVSRPAVHPGEPSLDRDVMARHAVTLPLTWTRLLLDSVVTDRGTAVTTPTTTVSLWDLSPLVKLGYDTWIPMGLCGEATVLLSPNEEPTDAIAAATTVYVSATCLPFGYRQE